MYMYIYYIYIYIYILYILYILDIYIYMYTVMQPTFSSHSVSEFSHLHREIQQKQEPGKPHV